MHYQVGSSLPPNAPSYIERQADQDFYERLWAGEFCYVLNSRQMGKSSLRVRTMQRLQAKGIACAVIDMTLIGSQQVTLDQWYATLVASLADSFQIEFNLSTWWDERELLPPVRRFSKFIEDVLLTAVTQNIVIFVDEIDSVLSLDFPTDDFFAFIRACYNQGANKSEYERLTFALLGVAAPSDLIQDKKRTPFNIGGQAIQLYGFQLKEAEPLARGLEARVSNPQAVLKEVLSWTGGQPFLTQKLCQLVLTSSPIPAGCEAEYVENLVRSQVIENWKFQDEPQHLKTISDRILGSQKHTIRILELYQQILQFGEVAADGSPEQMELRLSGLVVEKQGKLRVYNHIYKFVFNHSWVTQALSDLRPYAENLKVWIESSYKDESQLLQGPGLRSAQAWAAGKSLSIQDYQFLNASQELETRETVRKAKQQIDEEKRRAEQQIDEEKRKAKQQRRIGSIVLAISLLFLVWASIAVLQVNDALVAKKMQLSQVNNDLTIAQIQQWNLQSETLFGFNQQLKALIASVKAGQQLQEITSVQDKKLKDETVSTLQRLINNIVESNRLEGHNKVVNSVSFSPDGKTVASASGDKTIKFWKPDGTDLTTLKGHQGEVYSVSFSPDGKTIASASGDGTVKLWSWDGKKSKELTTLKGHQGEVYSVSFSPDGKTIASASGDKTIKLWSGNGKESKELTTLTGHTDKVNSVSFSPDGKTIASASGDGTVKLWSWDGKESTYLKTLTGHTDQVWSVSFSPDRKTIATASSDRTIKLWNLDGALLTSLKGHTDRVTSVSFSPNSKLIATASSDKNIRLWRLGSLPSVLQGHQGEVYSVSFSPDGKTIASASRDNTAKLWRWNDKEGTYRYLTTLTGHSDRVWSVRFSPDGKTIATASWDKTIKLWNPDGVLLTSLEGHTGWVFGISFRQDGQTIASVGSDKMIILWDLKNKKVKKQWNSRHGGNVVDVNFSPDGKTLATASDDQTVKLWRYPDGKCIRTLKGHSDEVNGVSFSPDGKMKVIATASDDRTVKLWRYPDGKYIRTLQGHNERVMNARFSPDGKMIATASFDKTVKLWKLDGTVLQTFSGHDDRVWDVSFSPDSKTLASASRDKTIRLWHFDSNNQQPSDIHTLLKVGCDWLRAYLSTNPNEESDRHICDDYFSGSNTKK